MKPAATIKSPAISVAISIKSEAAWSKAIIDVRAVTARAVRLALNSSVTSFDSQVQVSVLLTNDKEIRLLNKKWRDQDKPTNVLSFPGESPFDRVLKKSKTKSTLTSLAVKSRQKPVLLGDVVIARETILREAKIMGKPLRDHFTHLVVHGVLHLLGHNHEKPAEAKRMENLERKILAQLNIADPYEETFAHRGKVA